MIDAALLTLGETPFAEVMTSSQYLYPVVNATHILALASLFGSIMVLDLRLLGLLGTIEAQPLALVLPRIAGSALVAAALTGFLLFTVQPLDYAANPAFLAKVSLVALGIAHALGVHCSADWKRLVQHGGEVGWTLRASAFLSLLIWTGAIFAGRFIAF